MFTGIIEEVGHVTSLRDETSGRQMHIAASFAGELLIGQSIAVSGVCLTVNRLLPDSFGTVAVPETLRKTTLGRLQPGSEVNLERALPASGRFEGHIVQGHVDGTCQIARIQAGEHDRLYTLKSPSDLRPYLVSRGSVALDGISLTIARTTEITFTIAIIPHTFAHTTARSWRTGTPVNLECDIVGKIVSHYLATSRA